MARRNDVPYTSCLFVRCFGLNLISFCVLLLQIVFENLLQDTVDRNIAAVAVAVGLLLLLLLMMMMMMWHNGNGFRNGKCVLSSSSSPSTNIICTYAVGCFFSSQNRSFTGNLITWTTTASIADDVIIIIIIIIITTTTTTIANNTIIVIIIVHASTSRQNL